MNGLGQDVKAALRIFRKSPAFAAIVVLTLTIGSGANTAVFTLLDQVMLRPLPVERPERLVVLHAPGPDSGWSSSQSAVRPLSQPMLEGLRDRTSAFEGLRALQVPLHFATGGETERVSGDIISGTFFEMLGLRATQGRLFTRDDDRTPSKHPVVVLGHTFFERRFGGDASVVGRVVSVNRHPMTVIGVAPEGSGRRGRDVDRRLPPRGDAAEAEPTWGNRLGDWRSRWLVCMARLADGVSLGRGALPGERRLQTAPPEGPRASRGAVGEDEIGVPPEVAGAAPGRPRHVGLARPGRHAARRADGHGRIGAADRVR
jgi:hypothetical protein